MSEQGQKVKVKLRRHSFTAQKNQGAAADEENPAIDRSYTLSVQKSIPRESTAVTVGHCPRCCCCRRFNEAQAKRQTTSWKTVQLKWTRTLMCTEGMSTAAKTTNWSTGPVSVCILPFHRSFLWNNDENRENILINVFDTKHYHCECDLKETLIIFLLQRRLKIQAFWEMRASHNL